MGGLDFSVFFHLSGVKFITAQFEQGIEDLLTVLSTNLLGKLTENSKFNAEFQPAVSWLLAPCESKCFLLYLLQVWRGTGRDTVRAE